MGLLQIIEWAHKATHLIKFAGEFTEGGGNSKPRIMSDQELATYLQNSCEETNKGTPHEISARLRFEKIYFDASKSRTITYEYTLIQFNSDVGDIKAALAEQRKNDLAVYKFDKDFEKMCRANGVIKEFIINDMHGRRMGTNIIAPNDLK